MDHHVFRLSIVPWSLLLGLGLASGGQAPQPPKTGDFAPKLEIARMLQGPATPAEQNAEVSGKVIVLEFWATWCAPCVESIPHLNDLAQKFANRDVRLLSITDEAEDAVRLFLEKHPIRGWLALDPEKKMLKAYGVHGIPTTVVIGPDGRIAAMAFPYQITEEVLNQTLEGKAVHIPNAGKVVMTKAGEDPLGDTSVAPPVFRFEIRPATSIFATFSIDSKRGRYTAVSAEPLSLIQNAFVLPFSQILNRDILPKLRYTVIAVMPPGQPQMLFPLLQQLIPPALGVTARKEEREMNVPLLTAPSSASGLRKSEGTPPSTSSMGGALQLRGQPLSAVATFVQSALGVPVLDETHLEGRYDVELKFDQKDPQSLKVALKQLGLELVPGRRIVSVVVIEKAPADTGNPQP